MILLKIVYMIKGVSINLDSKNIGGPEPLRFTKIWDLWYYYGQRW